MEGGLGDKSLLERILDQERLFVYIIVFLNNRNYIMKII